MLVLRRVLKLQALLWVMGSLPEVVAPRWFLVTVFQQAEYPDYAYVRSMGIMCVGFALMMVLVAQRLEVVWWWAWAFAVINCALATVCALTAMFGASEGSATLYWWILAGTNAAFAALLMLGLGRASQENPQV